MSNGELKGELKRLMKRVIDLGDLDDVAHCFAEVCSDYGEEGERLAAYLDRGMATDWDRPGGPSAD
jgi:hypothetical protein